MQAKKNQIWFETNLGYEETKERLFKSGLIIGDGQDFGRFSFTLKGFKDYKVQVTKGGKLGIYYPVGCSYEPVLESLRPFLVTPEGKQADILDIIAHSEEEFPWVSPYVEPPENFRQYREIFEDLLRILRRKGPNLESYLKMLCNDCKRDLNKPPALPKICRECNQSLYHLTITLLKKYFPKKVPKSIIALFLLYEYKAHILIICCKAIRREYFELNDKDFAVFFESLWQRVRRLEDLDASLEPKIPEYVFNALPIAPPDDAERAINLAVEAVKWHIIRECSGFNLRVDKKFKEAYERFMSDGMKIINKALNSMSIKDFNKKLKRAYNILNRMEAMKRRNSILF